MMVHFAKRKIPCARCHLDSLVVALQWMVFAVQMVIIVVSAGISVTFLLNNA